MIEPLTKVDTAWLHMDSPTNHMVVTSVLVFEEPLDETRLRRILDARLLPHQRFRQRVVTPARRFREPEWELVEDFRLEDHIEHTTLPEPGGDLELQQFVGHLMGIPLDPTRPLWEMHIVDGFGRGSALVTRMHHCIADGIALVRLLLSLTDTQRDAEVDGGIPGWKRSEIAHRHADGSNHGLVGTAVHAAGAVKRGFIGPGRAAGLARDALGGLAAFVRVSALPAEPSMALKGPLGARKLAVWSHPIPLVRIKGIAKRVEGTVNDVLVATTAGAIRRYLAERGDTVDGLVIHATVPVNLRPADSPQELGNRFGLVYPVLPVGVAEPLARLRAVKAQMDSLKRSREAPMSLGILDLLGRTPAPIERAALDLYTSKSTMVLTNVPGPRTVIYLAGAALSRIIAWAPPSGSLSMSVSIHSYAGDVTIGVAVDAHLVPDPARILAGVDAELDALEVAAHEDAEAHRATVLVDAPGIAVPRASPPASAHAPRARRRAGERRVPLRASVSLDKSWAAIPPHEDRM